MTSRRHGDTPSYPIIGDSELNVAKLYDMLPAKREVARKDERPLTT
jgi:alkyl hydroperoxide reductase subunit AhpC